MRILVIEDDTGIALGLSVGLRQRGYAVDLVGNLADAWSALCVEPFDLVLLDLGLPDGDGRSLLERVRSSTATLPDAHTPVLIMTARDAVASRIEGLDSGADDYVTKPFDVDELEARMRALLRRAAGRAQPLLTRGDLSLNPATRTVHQAGQLVALSGREYAVLLALLQARGRVLSRAQIETTLYSFDQLLESNAIEVHIHHLRKKLGSQLIQTLRGVGYFVPQENA